MSPRPLHVSPSMSSPGCPYDNAAMENFFGTLKTECLYRARFSSRAEVEQLVAEYIHFYIFERISLKNGLTPLKMVLVFNRFFSFSVCSLGSSPKSGGAIYFRRIGTSSNAISAR